jgi:hypothetical protein
LSEALVNLLGSAGRFTERGHVDRTVCLVEESASVVLLRFEVRMWSRRRIDGSISPSYAWVTSAEDRLLFGGDLREW